MNALRSVCFSFLYDGHQYHSVNDYDEIVRWLNTNTTDPSTNLNLLSGNDIMNIIRLGEVEFKVDSEGKTGYDQRNDINAGCDPITQPGSQRQ